MNIPEGLDLRTAHIVLVTRVNDARRAYRKVQDAADDMLMTLNEAVIDLRVVEALIEREAERERP